MVDEGHQPVKGKGEVDEEMTVVVPPPKGTKLSGEQDRDLQGDIAMENTEPTESGAKEAEKVDPKVKAMSGMIRFPIGFLPC